jgi:hypothetical protein
MRTLIHFLLVIFWLATSPLRAAGLPDPVAFSNAIERGDLRQAGEWLEAGLPPDFEGQTIGSGLMIGAWEGSIPMMELFHNRGADVNKVNRLGEQALLHAAWKGRFEAVRWLVEHGARLDRLGKEWSALHYAVFAGHEEIVRFLLERGANANARSTNGSTPLMMAAREGKEEITARLLEVGARTDLVNDWNEGAAQWAMRQNNVRIARLIAGAEFAQLAARPPEPRGPAQRSQPVSDSVDQLLAQARRLEQAGKRTEALKFFRTALTAIRGQEARKPAAAARPASGMRITARRSDPSVQSAGIHYETPATISGQGDRKVGTGVAAVQSGDDHTEARVEELLAQARQMEAGGKRTEALKLYRQASAALRDR